MQEKKKSIPTAFLEQQKKAFPNVSMYGDYRILKIKDGDKFRFYAFREAIGAEGFEGAGSFGQVYAASIIDPDTGQFGGTVAVKVLQPEDRTSEVLYEKKKASQREVKYLRSKNLPAENPIVANGRIYVVMSYVPGETLDEEKFAKDTAYAFSESAKLMWLVALDLVRIHHATPLGKPLVHSDIKGGNTRVNVVNKKLEDARIVDFGLTDKISDDATVLKRNKGGTEIAPEQKKDSKQGRKSDIYSLGVMYQKILKEIKKNIPKELRDIIITFIQKMIAVNYDARPDIDEALSFFTALNNYCHANNNRKPEYLETLEVLANPAAVLSNKMRAKEPQNLWLLFLFASEHYQSYTPQWEWLNGEIKFTPEQEKIRELIHRFLKQKISDEENAAFFRALKAYMQVNGPRDRETIDVILDPHEFLSRRALPTQVDNIRRLTAHATGEKLVLLRETLDVLTMPNKMLLSKKIPTYPENQWRLFLYASEHYEINKEQWITLKQVLAQHKTSFTEEQRALEKIVSDFVHQENVEYSPYFFYMLKKHLDTPKSKYRETLEIFANPAAVLEKETLPQQPDNMLRLFLYASQHYKGHEEKWKVLKDIIKENMDSGKYDFSPNDQSAFRTAYRQVGDAAGLYHGAGGGLTK